MSPPKLDRRATLACVVHLSKIQDRIPFDRLSEVASAIMADARLPLETRGVALWLALHPYEGVILTSVLRQQIGCNLPRWSNIARTLEEGGYLVRDKQGGKGRWAWNTRFVVPDVITSTIAQTDC